MDIKQKSRLAGHSKKFDIETTILFGICFCLYISDPSSSKNGELNSHHLKILNINILKYGEFTNFKN